MVILLALVTILGLSCASKPPETQKSSPKEYVESIYDAAMKFSEQACKKQSDCSADSVCMNEKPEVSKCVKTLKGPEQIFDLPFSSGTKVVCTQSYGNLKGTHGWASAFYALDLTTPYDQPAGKVAAVAAGTAYISDACPNPSGNPSKLAFDRCGNGWGNNVRLDHGNGLISLYSHLSEVFVKSGDRVEARQIIGTEGGSGAAGHRHLHFDVQRIPGDERVWKEILGLPDVNGLSVPYKLRAKIDGKEVVIDPSRINCRWGDMSQKRWLTP